MSRITVRNLELRLVRELRRRAADRGWSPEEEARDILRIALSRRPSGARNSAASARAGVEPSGEREYDLSPSVLISEPPPPSPRGPVSEFPLSPRGPIIEAPPRSV